MIGRALHFAIALFIGAILLVWFLTLPNRRAFWLPNLGRLLSEPKKK